MCTHTHTYTHLMVRAQLMLLTINIYGDRGVSRRILRQSKMLASGGVLQSFLFIRPKPRTMWQNESTWTELQLQASVMEHLFCADNISRDVLVAWLRMVVCEYEQ
jgi:hypothetical protein